MEQCPLCQDVICQTVLKTRKIVEQQHTDGSHIEMKVSFHCLGSIVMQDLKSDDLFLLLVECINHH